MPTEFELTCATCGGSLDERSLGPDEVPLANVSGPLSVAQCTECGSRYYPETTLERL
jgi:uncharacterized protein with PIN domain